jgi:hypothetical protein
MVAAKSATRNAMPQRRRAVDMQVVHLEGRMDMIEQRIDQVDKKVGDIDTKVDAILSSVQKQEIANERRDGQIIRLEERFTSHFEKTSAASATTTTTTTISQEDGQLDKWRKTATNVLLICACFVGVLLLIKYASSSLLNQDTVKTGAEIIEHAP